MAPNFAKFLIFLEICFVIYWFIAQTVIIFTYDTISSEKYRAAGLFIGIHSLISPAAILYVINSPDKPHLTLLWIFIITLLYDMIELFDVSNRLDATIIPLAWNLQCAGVIWAFTMSVLAAVWYLTLSCSGNKSEKHLLK